MPHPGHPRGIPGVTRGTLGQPKIDLFSFLDLPSPTSKNGEFSTLPRNKQNGWVNRPCCVQGAFFDEKTSAAPRRGGERVKLRCEVSQYCQILIDSASPPTPNRQTSTLWCAWVYLYCICIYLYLLFFFCCFHIFLCFIFINIYYIWCVFVFSLSLALAPKTLAWWILAQVRSQLPTAMYPLWALEKETRGSRESLLIVVSLPRNRLL